MVIYRLNARFPALEPEQSDLGYVQTFEYIPGLERYVLEAYSFVFEGSVVEELSTGTVPKGDFATLEAGVVDSDPPESCQEGILGRPRLRIELGVEGDSGRLVTRSAFSDFSSCCSSASECVCASRFASSIYKSHSVRHSRLLSVQFQFNSPLVTCPEYCRPRCVSLASHFEIFLLQLEVQT